MKSIAELVPEVIARIDPSRQRMSGDLPDSVRAVIWNRDRGTCRYCGGPARTSFRRYGEIDHIVPCLRGGSDELGNLALACHICNARKGGRTPEEAGMPLRPIPEGIHG